MIGNSFAELIRNWDTIKIKLTNTASGFPGNEKIYADLYLEKITGLPGWMRRYSKKIFDFFFKNNEIKSTELKEDPPELIITSNFFWLLLKKSYILFSLSFRIPRSSISTFK